MARSWGRNTAVVWASAGSQLQPQQSSPRSWYPLGGFLNLSGLTPDAISAPHYAISRLIYYRKVGYGGEGFLNVPLYLGVSAELGNAWQDRGDISFGGARKDGSVFFGLDTFLGPAYVAAGYDDRGRSAFYLFLGRAF
jgi:NTE family protein